MPLLDFDKLWDYGKPTETEKKFRDLLAKPERPDDTSYRLQLLTQIARTQGLQRNFDSAHEILDTVEKELNQNLKVAKVRYLLERGRAFNSSKQIEKAKEKFIDAYNLSVECGEDFHTVDAAHMLGICEPAESSLRWNEIALKHAENSNDLSAQNWCGALYNNIGWTYHDKGEFDEALKLFKKALEWREQKGAIKPIRIGKWCVARALRSLKQLDEAIAIQRKLEAEYKNEAEPSGYVFEEIGECLLELGKGEEAKPYFNKANEILGKDLWLQANEKERLERLEKLGND